MKNPNRLLCRREKIHDASTAADCAEMQIFRKTGYFVDFGETGDSPDTLIFYFQHNKKSKNLGNSIVHFVIINKANAC